VTDGFLPILDVPNEAHHVFVPTHWRHVLAVQNPAQVNDVLVNQGADARTVLPQRVTANDLHYSTLPFFLTTAASRLCSSSKYRSSFAPCMKRVSVFAALIAAANSLLLTAF